MNEATLKTLTEIETSLISHTKSGKLQWHTDTDTAKLAFFGDLEILSPFENEPGFVALDLQLFDEQARLCIDGDFYAKPGGFNELLAVVVSAIEKDAEANLPEHHSNICGRVLTRKQKKRLKQRRSEVFEEDMDVELTLDPEYKS